MNKKLQGTIVLMNDKLKLSESEQAKKMEQNRKKDAIVERRKKILQNRVNKLNNKITKCNRELIKLADERRHITAYQSYLVSESVFIQYLKEHKGLDIAAIRDEIINLPEDKVVRNGAKIVELKH